MKRPWHAAGLVVVLAVLGAAWFMTMFEQVPEKVWVGPSAAARANPYLAAMRFAERLGMKSSITVSGRPLEGLPPRAALLVSNRRAGLSPSRVHALDRWIANGGHAIVEPEPFKDPDPLLDHYGISREAPKKPPTEATISIDVPGSDGAVVVSQVMAPSLRFQRQSPDIAVTDDRGTTIASIAIGAGRLTVLGGMRQRFHNRTIGQHDNAELLRRILGFTASAPALVVMHVPRALPLWDWLEEHALPTLAACAVLLALALARALARFGPLQPAPGLARRQLREHVLAAGRFRWTHGGREGLLAAARDVAARHIAHALPRLAQLPPHERWRELATRTSLAPASIANAFTGEPRSARDFVQIVGTLASIHARIGRRADLRSSPVRSS